MKFSANIGDLQSILPTVTAVVPTRSTLQQLENIQMELKAKKLTLMATDLEVSVRASIEVASKTDGTLSANAKRLSEIIRSLPDGDLNASLDKATKRLQLQSAQGTYTMATFAENELPDMRQEFKPEGSISAKGGDLKKMISTAIFAASTNEFRAAMMGLLFQFSPDGTTCVATDGHRLVKISNPDLKCESERDVIVPAKAVNLVAKSFADDSDVTINFSATQIEFSNESISILSRLIDEQYPNYEAVIPRENEKTMTISRQAVLSSNKRVMIFADPDTRQIRMQLSPNKLSILADNAEEGSNAEEHIACDYSADELLIGFNGRFIEEALAHVDSDEITMKFSTPTRATIIEPAKQGTFDVLMLVMPVRLSA